MLPLEGLVSILLRLILLLSKGLSTDIKDPGLLGVWIKRDVLSFPVFSTLFLPITINLVLLSE